jgi:hypothetical protein
MTPLQLILYYANLLILQYLGKPKAYATVEMLAGFGILPQVTVQQISFSATPTSGTFEFQWTPFGVNQTQVTSAAINWNDSASTIQTKIQAMSSALASVTVAGSVTSGTGLTVTFTGVPPVAPLLSTTANSLGVTITIAETDTVLPLAVSNGFNINSSLGAVATGNQLNIIAKYANVFRSTVLPTYGTVTLSDADFLTLIQFAIIKNSASSDLSTIQSLLNQFFPGEVLVFDYQNMYMSYLFSTSIGSTSLLQVLVGEGLLFKPLGVQLATAVFNSTITTFFGFRTYSINTVHNSPANTYSTYVTTRPWLSYSYGVSA